MMSTSFPLRLMLALVAVSFTARLSSQTTENVVLITVDGLRWQEVFHGAEELLLDKTVGGVMDTNRTRTAFWRATPADRRAALLPFFWSEIGRSGQLFGNQTRGSIARVTNGRNFTYPGFNEILAGFADDRIDKNAKLHNPNVTMLEWLQQKPAFTNRVRAVANWDVFPYILNSRRSGIPIWTGYDPDHAPSGPHGEALQRMFDDITPLWSGMNFDVYYLHAALAQIREHRPRVIWIAFSETDEWAHEGRYDLYLAAAHHMDRYVRTIWQQLQGTPQYRNKTSLFITCDHGRGSGPVEWKSHGAAVPGAEGIWLAALGPDIPARGERSAVPAIGQNQIAATMAALLGEDYHRAVPRSGSPIADILPERGKPGSASR